MTQEVPFSLSLPLFLALSFPLSKSRRRQCEPLSSHHARVGHATKAPPQPCLSSVTRTFNPIPYANEGVGRLIYALTDPRLLPPSFPLPRPTVCLPSPHYRRSLTSRNDAPVICPLPDPRATYFPSFSFFCYSPSPLFAPPPPSPHVCGVPGVYLDFRADKPSAIPSVTDPRSGTSGQGGTHHERVRPPALPPPPPLGSLPGCSVKVRQPKHRRFPPRWPSPPTPHRPNQMYFPCNILSPKPRSPPAPNRLPIPR